MDAVLPHSGREGAIELSVVIPVYGNAGSIAELVAELETVLAEGPPSEVVFVVDGSPDDSWARLRAALPNAAFRSQLVSHARNFGSFAAIRTGLAHARGRYISVIAADLQEPTSLVLDFHEALRGDRADIAVGVRESRADRARDRWSSSLFWSLYRRIVQPEIPAGGVDVFACTSRIRDQLLRLEESNSSLVGLLFWIGFRRVEVPYVRSARQHGTSGWTFRRKLRYLTDSVFAFTDLPIRLVAAVGLVGIFVSLLVATVVTVARLTGLIVVPGYAPTLIAISFFGALNLLSIGIIGSYLWRTFENTKRRPGSTVLGAERFDGTAAAPTPPTRTDVPEGARP